MIDTITSFLWLVGEWVWTRILASLGALLVVVVLAVMFTPLNHDGTWGNNAMKNITATTTVEFTLEGIDNQQQLEERIRVMIDKTRAQQQKEKAQEELEKLQRKQTSLE